MVVQTVTIAHILVASAWFGHKLLIPRDVKLSARHPESASLLFERMARAQRFGIGAGVATLGTGIWLVYLTTGPADAMLGTYVAFAAVIAMFVVGATVARPAWNRVRIAIEAGSTPDAVGGATGFGRALNLESLLWVFALTMMVIG